MKAKQLLIWLVILAVAAAAYFISEEAADKSEKARDEAQKVIRLQEPLEVQKLVLSGSSHPKPVIIERRAKEHRWLITQPLDYPADSLVVGALIDRIFALRAQGRLSDPGQPAEYGLAKPFLGISLLGSQGRKSELLLGDLTPDGKQIYAKLPQGKDILLLDAGEKSGLGKSLFALRDKTVLDFILGDVSKITLAKGKDRLVLTRKKGGARARWEFGDGGEASTEEVERLLAKIHALRALQFMDQGFDLAALGLEPGRGSLALELSDNGKTRRQGLWLGGEAPNAGGLYLRRVSGGPVMRVARAALGIWGKMRFDLAERRVFRLDRKDIVALEIQRGGKTLAFAKKNDQWRRSEPPGDDKSGTPGSLFTWELADLKWEKILPRSEGLLAKPRAVINFSLRSPQKGGDAGSKPKSFSLIIGGKDPKTGLLATKAAGDDRVWGIKADFWDRIPVYPKAKPQAPAN